MGRGRGGGSSRRSGGTLEGQGCAGFTYSYAFRVTTSIG